MLALAAMGVNEARHVVFSSIAIFIAGSTLFFVHCG